MLVVLADNAWRTALDQPESARPVLSAARVAGGASLAIISIIGTFVTLITANLPLGVLVALVVLALAVALRAGVWAWRAMPRPRRKSAR